MTDLIEDVRAGDMTGWPHGKIIHFDEKGEHLITYSPESFKVVRTDGGPWPEGSKPVSLSEKFLEFERLMDNRRKMIPFSEKGIELMKKINALRAEILARIKELQA